MYFKKRRRAVPYSDLRSRLEEHSSLKERDRWYEDGEQGSGPGRSFGFLPLDILADMHNFLLFKITLALLVVLIVFLCSFVNIPVTDSILDNIHYVTTWEMDFVAMGRSAVPAIKNLWEGNLESTLDKAVLAPEGSTGPEEELAFKPPLQGELEKTFGLQFDALLQREEMFYGLMFSVPQGTDVLASAGGRVLEIKKEPVYGLRLLLEHYPTGMETFYGYLEEVLVKEGEEVEQGQNIARTGLEPLGKKPSFYFEIREKGIPVDPLPLLAGE
ncbi:MAG: M23 family metallopeptidase [Firmicutes bacterium]|nr:M23 family metallopeptidase [Bacillota bacterium]